jgi:hypothetical protein
MIHNHDLIVCWTTVALGIVFLIYKKLRPTPGSEKVKNKKIYNYSQDYVLEQMKEVVSFSLKNSGIESDFNVHKNDKEVEISTQAMIKGTKYLIKFTCDYIYGDFQATVWDGHRLKDFLAVGHLKSKNTLSAMMKIKLRDF